MSKKAEDEYPSGREAPRATTAYKSRLASFAEEDSDSEDIDNNDTSLNEGAIDREAIELDRDDEEALDPSTEAAIEKALTLYPDKGEIAEERPR